MTRLVAFLPRLVALTVVWLLLTAAITFAAGQRLQSPPAPAAAPTTTTPTTTTPTVLVVPDVRHQAYVFAKGILEDAGFAWKVSGSVPGYAANLVAAQVPAPGTRVVDTGAPTIQLQLAKGSYPPQGDPEQASPFSGTKLELADVLPAAPKAVKRKAAAVVPAATTAAATTTAAAATTTTAAAATTKAAPKTSVPKPRTPAFTGPGTRPEPQDEPPLPDRAQKLERWIATRPKPTDGNVKYWLFQHAWIVAGAEAGWWKGDEALKTLIHVDRSVWELWGIGARSEAVARKALAEVEARSA